MAGCFQGDRFNATVLFALFYVTRWLFITPESSMFLLFLGSRCTSFCHSFHLYPPSLLLELCVLSATLWQIKAAKSKTLPATFASNGKKNHWDWMKARLSLWRAGLCVSTFDQLLSGLESSMSSPIRPELPSYWHSRSHQSLESISWKFQNISLFSVLLCLLNVLVLTIYTILNPVFDSAYGQQLFFSFLFFCIHPSFFHRLHGWGAAA